MMRSAARSKGTLVVMLVALGLVLVVVLTSPGSHPKPAQAQETGLTVARASLVVDGVEIAAFTEVDEITSSIKLPRADGKAAQLQPLRIVLERPASEDLSMSSWHQAATTQVTGYRKNVFLVLYNSSGQTTARFALKNAWPAEYHLDSVKAGADSIINERVTLTAASFQRLSPS